MRVSDNLKRSADAQLTAADRAASSAASAEGKEQAEDANAKAPAGGTELAAQWTAAEAELQPKFDTAASAREAAAVAENARAAAAEAARKAALDLEPVSVFVSRKTQRLYVRQAFQPILPLSGACRLGCLRHPPNSSRKTGQPPVLTSTNPLSTLQQRFACTRLAHNHTYRNPVPTFPQRSPPWLFDHSRLRWFEIST
jgi:hypothetical protein